MRVTITFHGPFRIATGTARPGLDATVEPDDLLPASSLKGVMRDAAETLLPDATGLVDAVFGSKRVSTAWAWSSAVFSEEPRLAVRGRVKLGEAGAAERRHLMFGEEVWARTAEFTVDRYAWLPQSGLDEDDQLAVLACAAAGVHSLGSARRRGLGWVECTPQDPIMDEKLIDRFRAVADRWRQRA